MAEDPKETADTDPENESDAAAEGKAADESDAPETSDTNEADPTDSIVGGEAVVAAKSGRQVSQTAIQHVDDRDLFDNTNIPADFAREGYKAPAPAEARIAGIGCLVAFIMFAGLLFAMKYLTHKAVDIDEDSYEARREVILREQEEDQQIAKSPPQPASVLEWTTSVPQALNNDQLVIVYFYARWNQASMDMKDASFENSDVVAEIRKRNLKTVAVKFSKNQATAKEYGVIAVPHLLILDASGKKMAEYHGLLGARDLVSALQVLDGPQK